MHFWQSCYRAPSMSVFARIFVLYRFGVKAAAEELVGGVVFRGR